MGGCIAILVDPNNAVIVGRVGDLGKLGERMLRQLGRAVDHCRGGLGKGVESRCVFGQLLD